MSLRPESPHESASPVVVSAQLPDPASSPVALRMRLLLLCSTFHLNIHRYQPYSMYSVHHPQMSRSCGHSSPESAHESACPVVVPAQPPEPTSSPVASQDEAGAVLAAPVLCDHTIHLWAHLLLACTGVRHGRRLDWGESMAVRSAAHFSAGMRGSSGAWYQLCHGMR
jgi:hypothetical protein